MKIDYDKKIDAKYVSFREGEVHATQVLKEWLMLDLDVNGNVLGVEILDASKNLVSLQTEDGRLLQINEMQQMSTESNEIGNVGKSQNPSLIPAIEVVMAS